jgi:hypothetical protein
MVWEVIVVKVTKQSAIVTCNLLIIQIGLIGTVEHTKMYENFYPESLTLFFE